MRKLSIIIALSIILSLLVMCRKGPAVIEGSISTIEGKIPPKMHVHIYKRGDDPFKPIRSIEAGADGSFKIEMPDEKLLELMVTAAGFPMLNFPVMNQENKNVQLKISLNHYEYVDDFKDIKLLGDWNNFSEEDPVSMTPQEDGTFVYEQVSSADTVSYQIYNIVKSSRSINGTMWDYLKYDGGGDYISVVKVKNNRARIIFDPKKLPGTNKENIPQVKVTGGDISMQPFIDIALRMNQELVKIQESISAYQEENNGLSDFKYKAPEFKKYLIEEIDQTEDSLLTKFAALQLARIWSLGVDVNSEELIKVTSVLPIYDELWGLHSVLSIRSFVTSFGDDKADSLFRENVESIKNKNVKAAVLLQLGLKAKADNKILDLVKFYKQLVKMKIDLPNYKYLLEQLDPDKNIFKGKDIPDFSFSLLNSNKPVSNKTLLGKYYLLDFWASWSEPYINELAGLHSAYKKYKTKNFTILSLSYDLNRTSIDKFLKGKWKMPWMHVFVHQIMKGDISKKFEVGGIPKAILVGPDGRILATDLELRGENLEKTLSKFIK